MLSFGQRLKLIRKEAQITQAELAEKLMVSVQAVSKWECDNTMPDISQIVPLAAILGVTTDCLLGVGGDEKADREKLYKEINAIFSDENISEYSRENNAYYKSYELCREHIKKYPLDYEIKYNCACDIYSFIYDAQRYSFLLSKDEEDSLYNEALNLFLSIINHDRNTTRLIAAKEALILLYLFRENFAKAEEVAEELPERGAIRATMEIEINAKKKDHEKCLEISKGICEEAVNNYLWALWIRARRISILGNDRKQEAIDAWSDLLDAARFNHNRFNELNIRSEEWWHEALNRLATDYIALSEFDRAFETIEELTDTLIHHYKKFKEEGDIAEAENTKKYFSYRLHRCYNLLFPTDDNIIAKDPRFKKCEERLAALD